MAADESTCSMPGLTFAFTVETLGLRIQLAERSGDLGGTPPEIASLVQRTKAAIAQFNRAQTAREKCVGKSTDACMQTFFDWDQAHGDVMAALNGWKPFIGS